MFCICCCSHLEVCVLYESHPVLCRLHPDAVLFCMQAVSEQGVVHFDLKCDNIFLQARPGITEQDFWSPPSEEPQFEVVLGDFGDSHDLSQSEAGHISM